MSGHASAISQPIGADGQVLVVDKRLEAYKSFFDHDWARLFLSEVTDTKLDPAALYLVTDWKGAACTARLPWLLLSSLESLHAGYLTHQEPFGQGLIRFLGEHVVAKMGDSLSNMKRKQLAKVIGDLGTDYQQIRQQMPVTFPVQEMWCQYLQIARQASTGIEPTPHRSRLPAGVGVSGPTLLHSS